MKKATIDFIGMYNYDNSLFDEFVIPEGMDKDMVVDSILLDTAELELLYSNYDFLKIALKHFSNKMLDVWTELYKTTKYDYDPLKSYNVDETINDQNILQSIDDRSITQHGTSNATGKNTTTPEGSETTETGVSAYDASDYQPSDKTTHTAGIKTTDNAESENSYADTKLDKNNRSQNASNNRTRNTSGTIGITKQSLIKQQRDVVKYCIVDKIVSDVKNQFCLLVY